MPKGAMDGYKQKLEEARSRLEEFRESEFPWESEFPNSDKDTEFPKSVKRDKEFPNSVISDFGKSESRKSESLRFGVSNSEKSISKYSSS